jgi:hypothetical protein
MNVNQHATGHSLSLSPKDLEKKKKKLLLLSVVFSLQKNSFFSPKDFFKKKTDR